MAGLVLAAFLGFVRQRRQDRERREQILYFAELINRFREIIVDDKWPRRPDLQGESLEIARRAIFRYMCEYLDRRLEGRATQLTFDERESLWRRIRLYTDFGYVNLPRLNPEDIQAFFEDLDTIEWLELTKHRTCQPVRGARIRRWFGFGR